MVRFYLRIKFSRKKFFSFKGVAGSFSEMVPVVHIVGTPPTSSQASGAILHHTLGNGDFRVFANMYKEITVSCFILKINKDCIISIRLLKRILQKIMLLKRLIVFSLYGNVLNFHFLIRHLSFLCSYVKCRPVYIGLAVDLSDFELTIDPSSIKPLNLTIPCNPKEEHQAAIEAVLDCAKKAETIIVLVDA
jgi:pyruvate decarboxylase